MSLTATFAPVIILSDDHAQESEVERLATDELRSRRAELVAALPQADVLLPGALVEQHRNCGRRDAGSHAANRTGRMCICRSPVG